MKGPSKPVLKGKSRKWSHEGFMKPIRREKSGKIGGFMSTRNRRVNHSDSEHKGLLETENLENKDLIYFCFRSFQVKKSL